MAFFMFITNTDIATAGACYNNIPCDRFSLFAWKVFQLSTVWNRQTKTSTTTKRKTNTFDILFERVMVDLLSRNWLLSVSARCRCVEVLMLARNWCRIVPEIQAQAHWFIGDFRFSNSDSVVYGICQYRAVIVGSSGNMWPELRRMRFLLAYNSNRIKMPFPGKNRFVCIAAVIRHFFLGHHLWHNAQKGLWFFKYGLIIFILIFTLTRSSTTNNTNENQFL